MSITLQVLKDPIDKNDSENVRSIQGYCKSEINKEIDKMDGNYKIPRDPFAEMNYVNDDIRSTILHGRDKLTVGAGRYAKHFLLRCLSTFSGDSKCFLLFEDLFQDFLSSISSIKQVHPKQIPELHIPTVF